MHSSTDPVASRASARGLDALLANRADRAAALTFISHGLHTIGSHPPPWVSEVTHLTLSDNQLRDLQGIEAFTGLVRLNLRNNHIDSLLELCRIPNKLHLLELDLTANPILQVPGLVPTIRAMFPA
jgi:Leucine-rich repeat (LRR) protein